MMSLMWFIVNDNAMYFQSNNIFVKCMANLTDASFRLCRF
ncbi:hypothetical protein P20652_3300 [Pseudoalteromonas sp. BSi20652]|nr:hypothetical protein P20652_3300 [Pseudoalteromonas sp. BSi20652]